MPCLSSFLPAPGLSIAFSGLSGSSLFLPLSPRITRISISFLPSPPSPLSARSPPSPSRPPSFPPLPVYTSPTPCPSPFLSTRGLYLASSGATLLALWLSGSYLSLLLPRYNEFSFPLPSSALRSPLAPAALPSLSRPPAHPPYLAVLTPSIPRSPAALIRSFPFSTPAHCLNVKLFSNQNATQHNVMYWISPKLLLSIGPIIHSNPTLESRWF